MTDSRLIIALDITSAEAVALADELRDHVRWLKVGMTLFCERGPRVVEELREKGFDVFVDLKLHDIPHQTAGAAANLARLGAGMLTVHATGGFEMIRAATDASREAAQDAGLPAPSVLAVTVLTSMDDSDLAGIGVARSAVEQTRLLSGLAKTAGVDGVVCSPHEAAEMRELLGREALVVTPGVRSRTSESNDQSRVASPAEALAAGASHIVVGRPVTGAPAPTQAVEMILAEIEGVAR